MEMRVDGGIPGYTLLEVTFSVVHEPMAMSMALSRADDSSRKVRVSYCAVQCPLSLRRSRVAVRILGHNDGFNSRPPCDVDLRRVCDITILSDPPSSFSLLS